MAFTLEIGEKAIDFKLPSTDGSVTAQNVQLNPQMRAGGQQPGGPASGSASATWGSSRSG